MSDTEQNSPQESQLQALLQMLDGQQDYNCIDNWLPNSEFCKKYKTDILEKLVNLPPEQPKL